MCNPKIIRQGEEIEDDGCVSKWYEINCESCENKNCECWYEFNQPNTN